MNNLFKFSSDNKRYHTYNFYLRSRYGKKVFKVPLDAGLPCPHADSGGCAFCGGAFRSSGAVLPLPEQFASATSALHRKWPEAGYIAYFQHGTNTNAPAELLRPLFEPFIRMENVVGIDIATRPDCLSAGVLSYLAELNGRTDLTVEMGLQTVHDSTAERMNRGYTTDAFLRGYAELSRHKIRVCAHIINSLPGETVGMMEETARVLGSLDPPIFGLKIHMLNIVKGSRLSREYADGRFGLLTRDEYVRVAVRQLELLRPETVILRISGDSEENDLIAPAFVRKKFVVLNEIDKRMRALGTYQGRCLGQERMP